MLVGGDEVTPRRGGSLENLRELAAVANSVRFGVLAIDSQARRADGARSRVLHVKRIRCTLMRCPHSSRRRNLRTSGCLARDRAVGAWVRAYIRGAREGLRFTDDLGKRAIYRVRNCNCKIV